MTRIAFAMLALVALPAFAPAPFPKTDRGRPVEINLDSLQGMWRLRTVLNTRANGQHVKHDWPTWKGIRIERTQWAIVCTFGETHFAIVLDGKQNPAGFHLVQTSEKDIRSRGILRRTGRRLEVIYLAGQPASPKSFASPPDGYWYLTLELEPTRGGGK